ncbi:hypothetical protein [Desulfosediminicola sp.]
MKNPKLEIKVPSISKVRDELKPEKLEAPQRPKPTPKPPKKK